MHEYEVLSFSCRFATMTDRFIVEFEKPEASKDPKLEVIIRGMRFIKIKASA